MKMTITRSGGFAGVSEELGSVDTATLGPAGARRLEEALASARFDSLPAVVPEDAMGADLLRYDITVERDGTRRRVTFVDDGSPGMEPLHALVRQVTELGG